jgi:hypothetical protein
MANEEHGERPREGVYTKGIERVRRDLAVKDAAP